MTKKLIAGLGNPGVKYKFTRHNLGAIMVDTMARRWKLDEKLDARINVSENAILIKPQVFMNDSGTCIFKALNYFKVDKDQLCVIHDDMDLPFLKVKKQFGSGSAGHNGVEDIVEKLGTTQFWRIRIGIGRPINTKMEISDWVLSNFSKTELSDINQLADYVKELVFQ